MRFASCGPALLGLALTVSFLLLAAPPTSACSICRCGDPTFNALGTDVYQEGAFRVFVDWERFDKEQGIAEAHHEDDEEDEHGLAAKHEGEEHGGATREGEVENRFTTSLSYSFGERVIAVARICMPKSVVRLSAGREDMSEETQALCFLAGANSIFYGPKLLTTPNPERDRDMRLLDKLGLKPMER